MSFRKRGIAATSLSILTVHSETRIIKTPQLKLCQSLFPRDWVELKIRSEGGGRNAVQGMLGLKIMISASAQLQNSCGISKGGERSLSNKATIKKKLKDVDTHTIHSDRCSVGLANSLTTNDKRYSGFPKTSVFQRPASLFLPSSLPIMSWQRTCV